MPRKPLDAPDDLRKQALSQLALAQLQDEVPGMSERLVAGRAVPTPPPSGPSIRGRDVGPLTPDPADEPAI